MRQMMWEMIPIFTWELDRSTGDKEQQPEMPHFCRLFMIEGYAKLHSLKSFSLFFVFLYLSGCRTRSLSANFGDKRRVRHWTLFLSLRFSWFLCSFAWAVVIVLLFAEDCQLEIRGAIANADGGISSYSVMSILKYMQRNKLPIKDTLICRACNEIIIRNVDSRRKDI